MAVNPELPELAVVSKMTFLTERSLLAPHIHGYHFAIGLQLRLTHDGEMGFAKEAAARTGTAISLAGNNKIVAVETSSRLNGRRVGGITDDDCVCVKERSARQRIGSYGKEFSIRIIQQKKATFRLTWRQIDNTRLCSQEAFVSRAAAGAIRGQRSHKTCRVSRCYRLINRVVEVLRPITAKQVRSITSYSSRRVVNVGQKPRRGPALKLARGTLSWQSP